MEIDKRKDDSFSSWTREQDKAFEIAIGTYSENDSNWWEKIAESVPEKSLEEIKDHYDLLISDINDIESGLVPLPCYTSSSDGSSNINNKNQGSGKKGGQFGNFDGEANSGSRVSRSEQERRKGIAWTEEEHRLFLVGLEKYGKGDWRSISRNYVVTRTPTQVASHAQKYFIRLNSENKERRRSSIHDITNINDGNAPSHGPITGLTNSPSTTTTGSQLSKPHNPTLPPVMGQPPPPHMAYGVRAPIHGPMVQGSPFNMSHMPYPTPRR